LKVKPPATFKELRDKFTSAYPMAKDWERTLRDDSDYYGEGETSEPKTSKVKAVALATYVSLIDERNNQNKKG